MFIKLVLILLIGSIQCRHQLAVYWGQDPAGGLRLLLEKSLSDYCVNYHYDIIPVAFLDIFFDRNNKNNYPGLNLANHCNTTFNGYPDLLNCTDIGDQIKTCQQFGKKILISLGGAAGLYGFQSSAQAVQFATTIWNLFLGGDSAVKPFKGVSLDGVDLDIEAGSTNYYADFIRTLQSLTVTDVDKKYLVTGAPQCPYPDVVMGPGTKGTVLYDIPEAFDYLFVQFYNNYCYLGDVTQFNPSIQSWFQFAKDTKSKHGKGPSIFIGLPAHPKASSQARYYQTPEQVQQIYETVKSNPNLGGIMLWDASFDSNNVINGEHYSTLISQFLLKDPPEVIICTIPLPGGGELFVSKLWIIVIAVLVTTIVLIGILIKCCRKKQVKETEIEMDEPMLL